MKLLKYPILAVALTSCGDDENTKSLESTQLIQDVRQTNYELKEARWELSVSYFDGGDGNFSKKEIFKNGRSKDKVQRVLDGGKFFIVTNDIKAERVVISPDGKLEDSQSVSQELTGCKLSGSSEMSGEASHIRIDMDWRLKAELSGAGCANLAELKTQFGNFLDAEVGRLNLKAGSDLFVSLEQPLSEVRSLTLKLKLKGEINPEAL